MTAEETTRRPSGPAIVRAAARAIVRAPVQPRAGREAGYLALSLLPAAPAFVLAMLGLAAIALSLVGVGLPLLAASLALARLAGRGFAGAARVTVGWTWSSPAPLRARGPARRIRELLRNGDAWRALLYCGLKLPLTAVGLYGAAIGYLLGLAFLISPAWWPLADGVIGRLGEGPWSRSWALAAQGALLLLAAPWFLRLVVGLDRFLAQRLIAPDPASARIAALQASRAALADDALVTLRRIERDLHDGTQAQLVAIGVALSRMDRYVADAEGRRILAGARQQILDALDELRDIIRGVHPPALDDGLPTALASLAARSPVPVELRDRLRVRPTDAQAAALYFCAAELLANVARHADAERIQLEIGDSAGQIVLAVRDDGRGGAAIADAIAADGTGSAGSSSAASGSAGTGLAGLRRRIFALDGTLGLDSPPGGPTAVTVTIPTEPQSIIAKEAP